MLYQSIRAYIIYMYYNSDALAQGNAYKPTKEHIYTCQRTAVHEKHSAILLFTKIQESENKSKSWESV